jgi:hypothetical protein
MTKVSRVVSPFIYEISTLALAAREPLSTNQHKYFTTGRNSSKELGLIKTKTARSICRIAAS